MKISARGIGKTLAACLTLLMACSTSFAGPASTTDRKDILDAARPAISAMAGQAVKFKVDILNVDANWAVLVGGLLQADGKPIDWKKAASCNPDLDKMLWVVLAKADGNWRVAQAEICASEPPYWYISDYLWPCGVYTGLIEGERNLERECRGSRKTR
ncbi:hypothetical protein ACO0LO_07935 [Undibacterium sp. TJN25]|uniref:hypothetical protein n=1 Tax=Undibacterium sp. TJN25 TaxID=3413056 RepID=UPI003BF1F436